MGCNCKSKNSSIGDIPVISFDNIKDKYPLIGNSILFITKIILFIMATIISIIIVLPASLYISFKISFIKKGNELDLTKNILKFAKFYSKFKNNRDDDDDDDDHDDDDSFDYSDVELLDVEDIKT